MNAKHAKFAVKSAVAALALAGSLAAVAPAAHAERVETPGTDSSSVQIFCHSLQGQIDAQVQAYTAAYNAQDGARMDAARTELSRLGGQWNAACRSSYGNISAPAQRIISSPKVPSRNVGIG